MSPSATFARSAFRHSTFRAAFQNANGFRQGGAGAGRRWQSTTAETAQASWFKRMWDSPVGLKTVHFWAPIMKWGIVIAGISDFGRPAEKLSLTQNVALTATGLIWTRWCLIIKPKNYLLAAVNFFLGIVGIVQVSRILTWQQSQKNKPVTEQIKEAAVEAKTEVKEKVKEATS